MKPTERTFIHHKTGKPAIMNTSNIGKSKPEDSAVTVNVDSEKRTAADTTINGAAEATPQTAMAAGRNKKSLLNNE